MANNGTIITAPLDTDDVVTVLGEASHNVGTLCKSPNIRKWSICKPIRDPHVWIFIVDADSTDGSGNPIYNNSVTQMYMGADATQSNGIGSFGLNIVAHTNLADLIDDSATEHDWEYLRPTGEYSLIGAKLTDETKMTPYRLTDFENYHHGAVSPFGELLDVPSAITNNANSNFNASITGYHPIPNAGPTATNSAQAGSIRREWLYAPCCAPDSSGVPQSGTARTSFDNLYFGVAAFKRNSAGAWEVFWKMTASTPGTLEATGLQLVNSALKSGDYVMMVPFLTNQKFGTTTNQNNLTRFFTLPDVAPVQVKITSDSAEAHGIHFYITGSLGDPVIGQVLITCSVAQTLTVSGIILLDGDGNALDSKNNVGTYTFAKNESKTVYFTFHQNSYWATRPPSAVRVVINSAYEKTQVLKKSTSGNLEDLELVLP